MEHFYVKFDIVATVLEMSIEKNRQTNKRTTSAWVTTTTTTAAAFTAFVRAYLAFQHSSASRQLC